MISIKNISKKFGNKTVLDNITFDIKDGIVLGLVGLNGIGKTTLIKTILDMLNPSSGTITINGIDNKDHKSRKSIYFLPEKFTPSAYLKGFEFLEISMSFLNKPFDFEKARYYANKLDLDLNVLTNTIGSYSKGMGQKLGLVSAFLSDASILILDEPMSGLDPKSRIMLKQVIKEYMQEQNRCIFFSSHILADVDELCQEIAILHDTKIRYLGGTEEFKRQQGNENLEKAFLNCIS